MNRIMPIFPYSRIICDNRGVYTLQIVDAKSLNILSTAVILGLIEAVSWIADQADARAVILRGAGEKAFVGGADIYEMENLDATSSRPFITNLGNLCEAVRSIAVPTIARIPGYCLGGGLELAAACDIRLASEHAKFGMPEVRVGIPSVIHALLLPSMIGPGAANWLMLTGESVDAHQALKWGLVQFVVTHDQLDDLVEQTVAAIVAAAPSAIRSQKQLLRFWETSSVKAGLDRSVDHFAQAFDSGEPKRYMAPFSDRRSGKE